MSTSINLEREQLGERPQTLEELVAAIGLVTVEGVNTNLRLQALSVGLEFEQFAAQARYEAEAWGKMMKKLRELDAIG